MANKARNWVKRRKRGKHCLYEVFFFFCIHLAFVDYRPPVQCTREISELFVVRGSAIYETVMHTIIDVFACVQAEQSTKQYKKNSAELNKLLACFCSTHSHAELGVFFTALFCLYYRCVKFMLCSCYMRFSLSFFHID